ncbi:MAG: rod-binding protein, partial [Alphaproteobacteria bacterium]|nr:rod-binding protein [Alphaproteobacteria bacterium]
SMFDGVSTNGMFGGGEAEKMYRSLLLDEYGKEMAKLGGIGVQDQVMRTILEMQEMAENGYIEA